MHTKLRALQMRKWKSHCIFQEAATKQCVYITETQEGTFYFFVASTYRPTVFLEHAWKVISKLHVWVNDSFSHTKSIEFHVIYIKRAESQCVHLWNFLFRLYISAVLRIRNTSCECYLFIFKCRFRFRKSGFKCVIVFRFKTFFLICRLFEKSAVPWFTVQIFHLISSEFKE